MTIKLYGDLMKVQARIEVKNLSRMVTLFQRYSLNNAIMVEILPQRCLISTDGELLDLMPLLNKLKGLNISWTLTRGQIVIEYFEGTSRVAVQTEEASKHDTGVLTIGQ